MRRLTDEPETPTAPTTGAGVAAALPWRRLAPYLAFTLACYTVAPYLGLDSFEVDPRIAEVWPPGGVGFVLLTVVSYVGRRAVAVTLAAMVAIFAGTAMLLGEPVTASLWWAVTGALQPLAMIAAYRRRLSHPGWDPRSTMDLAALFYAALATSVGLALVGGFPGLELGQVPDEVQLWWVLRNTVFCFSGAATFMVLFYRRIPDALTPSGTATRVWLAALAVVCVFGAYHDPSLPLSWLLIVPSVWGGLTLTMREGAFLSLWVALLAAAMSYLPQNQFGYGGVLPASSIVDLLVIASTAFTLLLVLMREQRAELISALDRKGRDSEHQRQVLETVFEAMTDGVMIGNADGVSLYNSAARQLLGRPIPRGQPRSWVDAFDATAADGGRLTHGDLRRALFPEDGPSGSLEIRVPHGGADRILRLSTQPLASPGHEGENLLLLQDVTSTATRMRELSGFAGRVAHDLRGPLTVMEGWLELALDELGSLEAPAAGAVLKAREAGARMLGVIEDWLAYTVLQNGRLQPVPLPLADLTEQVIESYRSGWADGSAPVFTVAAPHRIQGDPAMMRQVMDNLIGNAIKYTEPGADPQIAITSTPDDEPGWVRVQVADRGMGIPEGDEELIFEEFHRGARAGRSAGTGLGLALTRQIVALHGGAISARRNVEGGSTFTFTVPEA